jgi:hypothetical protein
MLVDPPLGWQYGFPKKLPSPPPEDVCKWIVEQGYPQHVLERMGKHFYVRYIYEEGDEE